MFPFIDPIALTSVYAAILQGQYAKAARERSLVDPHSAQHTINAERVGVYGERVTGIYPAQYGSSRVADPRCLYCKGQYVGQRCPSCGATARE